MFSRNEFRAFANVCLGGTGLYVKELNFPVRTWLWGDGIPVKPGPGASMKLTEKAKL
jgi:hypothetical protein